MDEVGHYEVWKDNRMIKRLANKSQARGFVKACIMIGANVDDYTIYRIVNSNMVNVTDNVMKDVITNP